MQALDKNKLLPFLYELSGLGYDIDSAIEKVETYQPVQAFTEEQVILAMDKMNTAIKDMPAHILAFDKRYFDGYQDAISEVNKYIQEGIETMKRRGKEDEEI